MTVYHTLQLLLAAWVLALVSERTRTLFYRAPLDARPFRLAAMRALREQSWEAARRLAKAGRPAWIARVLDRAADARDRGEPIAPVLDEVFAELRFEAERHLVSLRVMASLASAVGMLGALLEALAFLRGDHGLAGLLAGLPEKLAFERALFSLVLGGATAAVALASRHMLQRQAARVLREASEMAQAVEVAGGEAPARASRPLKQG